ncbi:hypothetical protein LP419_16865 [Massilia sp. H-1]|nr:hypothetical protein LP419_16865 [Massilia sp. H-1]
MFLAIDGPQRYLVQDMPDAASELIVWDVPEAPPANLRAPLWWIGDSAAFPELKNAPAVDGIAYADSARGRLWTSRAWPAADPDTARAVRGLAAPAPSAGRVAGARRRSLPRRRASGWRPRMAALRFLMMVALLALFALERILTHAKRR